MSRTAAARRAAVAALAGLSALGMVACSAGQVTQTSDQVAAVDGNSANTENHSVAVRDVTVVLDQNNAASLKFTAINQDTTNTDHILKAVTVGGMDVDMDKAPITIAPGDSVVAGPAQMIAEMVPVEETGITYVITSMENTGLAAGGNKEVTFTFDNESVTLPATVAGITLEAGKEERNATQDVDAVQHGEGHNH